MEVLDRSDMANIITWLPHGRAFIVRNSQQVREVVLPRFFKQTKFMSFTRQLNLWGFKRITKGTDQGAYYHELFLRGRPLLSMLMRRQKIKGTGIKLTPNPDTEPDFYKISDKSPLPPSTVSAEPKPLPPISRAVTASRANRNRIKTGYNHPMAGRNVDSFLQQQRQQLAEGHPSSQYGNQMMPPLLSYQDSYGVPLNMFNGGEQHRPFQRLSAPVTRMDFSMINDTLQRQRKPTFNPQQQAMASAQQVLQDASSFTRPVPMHNPVEELKQKLLNAVQSLEQAQGYQYQNQNVAAQAPMDQHRFNLGMLGTLNEHDVGEQGLPRLNAYQPSSMFPPPRVNSYNNSNMGQSRQQPPPASQSQQQSGTSIQALMTALDQTRQVAAAAAAQSSLLEKVAKDLTRNN